MNRDYIEIEKENIPYRFEIELGAEIFEMEVRYNDADDYFTIDLFKNKEVLICGEKVIYGTPLFRDVYDENFPGPQIVPLDESGKESEVTFRNFNNTVFLVIDNG